MVEKLAVPPAPVVEPAAKAIPVEALPAEKAPLVDKILQPAFCAWCGTVHAGGVSNCPTAATEQRSPVQGPGWMEKIPAVRESTPTGWQDRKTEKPFRVEYKTHNGKYVE